MYVKETPLIYVKSCGEQGLLMPKWPFTTRISRKMRKTDVNGLGWEAWDRPELTLAPAGINNLIEKF